MFQNIQNCVNRTKSNHINARQTNFIIYRMWKAITDNEHTQQHMLITNKT